LVPAVVRLAAVRFPLTVTDPAVMPVRFRVPVPMLALATTSAPDPARIRLNAPVTAPKVTIPLVALKVVSAVITTPVVPKFNADAVALIVPATLLPDGAVAIAPPVKLVVVAAIVKVPVFANVVVPAIVFVAPPSRTSYACAVPAAPIPVVAVRFPWKSTVCPACVSLIVTVAAFTVFENMVPFELATVMEVPATMAPEKV
jgi:hypothetical protein